MPYYEYRREDGSNFTVKQKMDDEPLKECPETGQECKRIFSTSTLIFKGEGFYVNDYGKG